MPRQITKRQLTELWVSEFAPHAHCCLCGNSGAIDTRGRVFTPAGVECGALVHCICPNGRAFKAANAFPYGFQQEASDE